MRLKQKRGRKSPPDHAHEECLRWPPDFGQGDKLVSL